MVAAHKEDDVQERQRDRTDPGLTNAALLLLSAFAVRTT